MFRRIVIWFLACITCFCISCTTSNEPDNNKLVLATMGASLMYPENGWVEKACQQQNIRCLNKAVSSKLIIDFAQQLWNNTYATEEELKQIDILLIQFANCGDVCGDSTTMFPTADDYTRNYTIFSEELFTEYSHAQQMDYILKRWQQICTQYNKPMQVILVTHWHDGRTTYNESVRKLAQRWEAEVCELDTYIGFTKDQPLPDGRQPSIIYAKDTEIIDGIEYGWHPLREKEGEYIQSVMADILKDKLQEYLKNHSIR